jgi:hypothetical protein
MRDNIFFSFDVVSGIPVAYSYLFHFNAPISVFGQALLPLLYPPVVWTYRRRTANEQLAISN